MHGGKLTEVKAFMKRWHTLQVMPAGWVNLVAWRQQLHSTPLHDCMYRITDSQGCCNWIAVDSTS